MRNRVYLGVTAAALAATVPAHALPPQFKAEADRMLSSAYDPAGPGAQVVISEHGRIVYSASTGLADIAAKTPIDQRTMFRMGSITKQFAASVVLQLVAEKKLKLDDPISLYLKDYPGGSGITVRELLNHTSGIQDYTEIPGWMVESNTARAYTTAELMAVFKDLPAPSNPGAKWAYNNSGYVLVGALIESVTGKPWYEEVDRRIARPLGLKAIHSGLDEASFPTVAKGYTKTEDGKVGPAMVIHMSVPGAAGALDGTAADLARWADALHHGKVVPAPLYAQMIAPTKMPDGKSEDYGFGLVPEIARGESAVGHGGGIFGFSTDSLYLPRQELFIAIFANSDTPKTQPRTLARKLVALALGKPYLTFTEHKTDPEAVKPWVGTYQFESAERSFELEDGKLVAARTGGARGPVMSAGGSRFFYPGGSLSYFDLARDEAGKPIIRFYAEGEEPAEVGRWAGPVKKLESFDVPRAALDSYVGSYTSKIGKIAIATDAKAELTVQLPGQQAFAMRALAIDRFMVDQVGAAIQFESVNGKVSGLHIEQGGRILPATRD